MYLKLFHAGMPECATPRSVPLLSAAELPHRARHGGCSLPRARFWERFQGLGSTQTWSAAAKLTRLKVKGPEMSDCLHCKINQLVQQHLERGDIDLAEVASMMVESLADLILLAPEAEQANLMAYVVSGLGQMFLEKSGAGEGGSSATH
jgi:hypothetical protein